MDSRFYFLFSCALLAGCMPTRQPSPDAFMQSELMPFFDEILPEVKGSASEERRTF